MNYFDTNPLKVTILSKSSNDIIQKTYIVVGCVPLKIQKEIEKRPKKSSILKGIYGANWRFKLGMDLYSGGDESEESISEESSILVPMESNIEPMTTMDVVDTPVKETPVEETPVVETPVVEVQEIELDIEFDTTALTPGALPDDIISTPTKIKTTKKRVLYVFDVDIFSEDKISELKRKLYIITGIPIYRQHLWYEIDRVSTPLSYIMYKYDNKVYIDINDIFNITPDTVTVEGIPVEMSIYENKANIKVIAYDEFRILNTVFADYILEDKF